MKNILVDLYKIKGLNSGLGNFSRNFGNELIKQLPESYKVDFLIPQKAKNHFRDENINIVRTSLRKRYFPFLNKNYFIWHSLQQFPSFFPKKNSIQILTIHDLNFLIEKKEPKISKYLKRLQKNVDRADYITTISNYTKGQIEKHINLNGKKIYMIYNGVNSGADIKKINHLKLNDRILLPGEISEATKKWLYANCEAFLFPSLAEGFGMPVIEAMNEGKPVFLSTHTSLPEIGGTKAFYFDNFEAKYMANLIRFKLKYVNQNRENFSVDLKEYAKKFSWETCMKKYINLYKEIESKTQVK